MPKEFSRTQRIAHLFQRELADIISREIQHQALGLITISAVDVSPDLKNAKIYITSLNSALTHSEISDYLNQQSSLLRHLLAQRLKDMRYMPRLQFIYDESVEYGSRLSALIDSLHPDTKK
ncbi:30S ribosome-binding factor RbfA [Thioflexithrix psekupsensis]|uniref:Ribosome-binding factor A n=1 Tax=Thioflexithrix psekupsensis TaxID=1570016 RepID=A0A251XB55_9GAMM|nr:30S ribosome-binding factor RbfA [Thioflexithrix psekupsensis]OUD15306.1 ribosome-binding factor A [Thioflexithrix psekupsensis]